MEKINTIKSEYNSIEKLLDFVKTDSSYTCSEEYDIWDIRTDENGQMKKCILVKKSSMHGMKMYFNKENKVQMTYVIPNKMMNTYFGKSIRIRRSLLNTITGLIKDAVLIGPQKKAFAEMSKVLDKIAA